MRESVTRRECKDGGMCDDLGTWKSPRGFTAARLTLPSGTEFEQPNHWGGASDTDSQRQPGSEGSSGGGPGVNLGDGGEKRRRCGKGRVSCGSMRGDR